MRIIYFHQHFSTPKGAVGTRSYEMAQTLISRGHQVTMVCGSYGPGNTGLTIPFHNGRREGSVDGIDVIEFDLAYGNEQSFASRTWVFVKFALSSVKLALRQPYDLIFCTSTPLTAAIPGIVARWLRKKPFVFEVRDVWPELPQAMGVITNPLILFAMGMLERAAYYSAKHILTLAPGMIDSINRRCSPDAQLHLIPNGCDIDAFAPYLESDMPLAHQFNPDKFNVVFAGAHGRANGLMHVLQAALELQRRGNQHIHFTLIGEGSEKTKLQKYTQEHGLDNVTFVDSIPKQALIPVLKQADVGLMVLEDIPAFYDGTSPNKFFDYIAIGLPVLCNYPGWIAGLIEKQGCGLSCSPRDPQAFANAVEQLASDSTDLTAMGENAIELAREQFDRRDLSNQFANVLEHAA